MVGPPKVINKQLNEKLLEPYEVIFHCFSKEKKKKIKISYDNTCFRSYLTDREI